MKCISILGSLAVLTAVLVTPCNVHSQENTSEGSPLPFNVLVAVKPRIQAYLKARTQQISELALKYESVIEARLNKAAGAGDLKLATAFQEEKKRIGALTKILAAEEKDSFKAAQRKDTLSALPPVTQESLVELRKIWTTEWQKIRTKLDGELQQSLKAIEIKFTKAVDLENAKKILTLRESLISGAPVVFEVGAGLSPASNIPKPKPDNKEFLVGKTIGFPHNNDPTKLGYFSFQKDGKALWLGMRNQAVPREYKPTGKPRQFRLWWPERKNLGDYQITVGPEGKTAEMVQLGINGEVVKVTNGIIEETSVSEAPKVSVEDYLLKNKFVFFFFPDRSKTVTFLRKGTIGEGSNRIDHSWKIEEDEKHFMNSDGEVTFRFRFDGIGKPLRQNSSPQLYKGRGAYLELIK